MADNRRAYGLAKRYGIDTKGMTPAEVWEALKEKGITSNNAYDSRDDFGRTVERVRDKTSRAEPISEPSKFNRLNTKNHIRHAKELGYKNQTEYEKAAIDFFNSARGKLYYSSARFRYYKYDASTGEFVVSSDGVVHTYFKVTQKKFEKIKRQDVLDEI